jgi:ABC-type branched-subunit amino acid transport system ATPase component
VSPLLEVRNVIARHGPLVALRGVSLTVAAGEIVGVFGPNGSGKTTLLDAICGLQRPDSGRIVLGGTAIDGRAPWDITRRGIGRTLQIPRPFTAFTVLDNVRLGLTFAATPPPAEARMHSEAEAILRRVGLGGRGSAPARTLSLGDRKRLELALALSTRPRLLLLDELAAGLSPRGRGEVMRFYGRLRDSGIAILAVEHTVSALADVADRLVLMSGGAVVAHGAPNDVLLLPDVSAAYLGDRDP